MPPAPPVAMPPAKHPILTILKQARAYGVGMVLSTQNPVDVDYKALSNAGTWMIGRLQTENDKKRILEGLADAGGSTDVAAVDRLGSNLDKRQFVLRQAGEQEPTVFVSRWAMSYLAGPLDRSQITALTSAAEPSVERPTESATDPDPEPAARTTLPEGTVPMMPQVAAGTGVARLDPAAAWAEEIGAVPQPTHLRAAGVATVVALWPSSSALATVAPTMPSPALS